jgi:large subunit ribosomal protein L25
MKTVSLSGSSRASVGKKDAADLRKSDRVPGVLYGGKEQKHFSVPRLAIDRLVFSPDTYLIELEVDGFKAQSVIKDVQFHPVTDKILHFDLLEVVADKPVTVQLPVRTTGNSVGVISGGRLAINFRKLAVKGLSKDLPEAIEIDITNLNVGDKVRVSDVQIPGCQLTQAGSAVVVDIRSTRATMQAKADAAGK